MFVKNSGNAIKVNQCNNETKQFSNIVQFKTFLYSARQRF